jgi:hypothetical protein
MRRAQRGTGHSRVVRTGRFSGPAPESNREPFAPTGTTGVPTSPAAARAEGVGAWVGGRRRAPRIRPRRAQGALRAAGARRGRSLRSHRAGGPPAQRRLRTGTSPGPLSALGRERRNAPESPMLRSPSGA